MSSFINVVTSAESTDLVSVADAMAAYDIDDGAKAQDWVSQASAAIVGYIKRPISREQVKQTVRNNPALSGLCPAPVVLTRRPVDPVGLVVSVSGATLAEAEYELDQRAGLIWRVDASGERVSWPASKIEITYWGGYSVIPADLQRACLLMVGNYSSADGRDTLVKSESVDGIGRTDYVVSASQGGIPQDVADLLAPYKRVVV